VNTLRLVVRVGNEPAPPRSSRPTDARGGSLVSPTRSRTGCVKSCDPLGRRRGSRSLDAAAARVRPSPCRRRWPSQDHVLDAAALRIPGRKRLNRGAVSFAELLTAGDQGHVPRLHRHAREASRGLSRAARADRDCRSAIRVDVDPGPSARRRAGFCKSRSPLVRSSSSTCLRDPVDASSGSRQWRGHTQKPNV